MKFLAFFLLLRSSARMHGTHAPGPRTHACPCMSWRNKYYYASLILPLRACMHAWSKLDLSDPPRHSLAAMAGEEAPIELWSGPGDRRGDDARAQPNRQAMPPCPAPPALNSQGAGGEDRRQHRDTRHNSHHALTLTRSLSPYLMQLGHTYARTVRVLNAS